MTEFEKKQRNKVTEIYESVLVSRQASPQGKSYQATFHELLSVTCNRN